MVCDMEKKNATKLEENDNQRTLLKEIKNFLNFPIYVSTNFPKILLNKDVNLLSNANRDKLN